MKVAVAATGDNLDAPADPRFGRCPYFVVVDDETMAVEAIENNAAMAASGAAIAAAQTVANAGAEAVIAGSFGPNAFSTLSAGGIEVYSFPGGTVREAVQALKAGQLEPVSAASVAPKSGMGGGGRGRRGGRG